jgi:Flagellar motor protein
MGMTAGEKKAWEKGFEEGENSVEEGLPGWFGTFPDMMTLLFAFLVLLAAYLYYGSCKIAGDGKLTGKNH